MDIFKFFKLELTEEDFEGAPTTIEPDGVFQMLFIGKRKVYLRNVDTGEITVTKM